MKKFWNFDLSKCQDVVDRADDINSRLIAGDMPCDGSWPSEQVQLFADWIGGGKQP